MGFFFPWTYCILMSLLHIQVYYSGTIFMCKVTMRHRPPLALICIMDKEYVKSSQSPLSLICIWEIAQPVREYTTTSPRTLPFSLIAHIFRKKSQSKTKRRKIANSAWQKKTMVSKRWQLYISGGVNFPSSFKTHYPESWIIILHLWTHTSHNYQLIDTSAYIQRH